MKTVKKSIIFVLLFSLAGCGLFYPHDSIESINSPEVVPVPDTTYSVKAVRVSVPDTLVVSEANSYFPSADIVWHGDEFGDRREQVRAIFNDGMTRALAALHGPRAIYVDVEVTRFHAITDRARYTVSGVHRIRFILTLRDVETGVTIGAPRLVDADLIALGGERAIWADRQGITQKRRIMSQLAGVIQREMINAETNAAVAALPGFVPN